MYKGKRIKKRVDKSKNRMPSPRRVNKSVKPSLRSSRKGDNDGKIKSKKTPPSSSKNLLLPSARLITTQAAHLSVVEEHRQFWDALPDHEFFGSSVTHIYFYSAVDEQSVSTLRQEILEAARGTQIATSGEGAPSPSEGQIIRVSPKPIIVHVHCPGGQFWAGNWLFSLFNQVHVPICTMVDSESASAATFLTVTSPYRVATSYSKSMLHDYWALMAGKREELLANHDALERRAQQMKKMYLSRTKFTAEELDDIMRRDIWLDANVCFEKGIYDRIIQPNKADKANLTISRIHRSFENASSSSSSGSRATAAGAPFFKTNWNVLYSACASKLPVELDALLSAKQSTKPVIYTTPGELVCDDPMIMYACIPRVLSFEVPVFGVVDNDLSWFEMLPIQFCHRRFMYDNAHVVSYLAYIEAYGRLQDVVHNTKMDRDLIVKVLKQRGKPSEEFLKDIFERARYISAEECLKMGLIDEVVKTGMPDVDALIKPTATRAIQQQPPQVSQPPPLKTRKKKHHPHQRRLRTVE